MTDREQPGQFEPGTTANSTPAASPTPAPKRARSLRWLWWTLGGIVLILGIAAAVTGIQARRLLYQPQRFATPKSFVVERKDTLARVSKRLEDEHIIPNAVALRLYARFSGKQNKLKAGEYEISGKMTPVEILDLLDSGHVKSLWVTIPEGKWASEIAEIVKEQWPNTPGDFGRLVDEPARWREKFPFLEGTSLEGYLFPDTYLVPKSATADTVITAMLDGFKTKCAKTYAEQPPADGRTLYQVLTLASLVEAEAKVDSERPTIAGVYMNRLRKGMKLQCDATVLFAKHERLSRVLYSDLEYNSPYNTYVVTGLPVGPICNPGLASFNAALHPADVTYLYYVARGDGTHIFSNTADEHAAAIRQVRGQ